MPLLIPKHRFFRVTDIPVSFFSERGIRGVILDVDNTLTTHDNPAPAAGVLRWLGVMRKSGCRMIILSNNSPQRVKPFADMLGLEFEADAGKPMTGGIMRACRSMNTPPHKTAMIGDQIFTDILGGNIAGLTTVFVEPIEPEKGPFFRFKRFLEKFILK